jgi:ribonuclease R
LHPRGFGFVDQLTPTADTAPNLAAVPAPSAAFLPPPLAGLLLDADRVTATVAVTDDGKATVTATALVDRPRRLLVGTVGRTGKHLVLQLPPELAGKAWQLPAGTTMSIGAGLVVAIADTDTGWRTTKVVAGPLDPVTPAWARTLAAVRALEPATVELPEAFRHRTVDPATVQLHDVVAAVRGTDPTHRHDRGQPPPTPDRRRRHRGVFTVDSPGTRDLDDAIVAWPVPGGVAVEVHIADVAAAVAAGSPVDASAAARGTSVYLAGGNLPMLPRELSEDRLSLRPGVDRHTVAVRFVVPTVGPDTGVPAQVEVFLATIRSQARLSYHQVEAHLTGTAAVPAAVRSSVDAAAAAADALSVARARRSTLESLFTPSELDVCLDGGQVVIRRLDDTPTAQRLVERLMVAANEAVPGWLFDRGYDAVLRTHPGIDSDAVSELEYFAGRPVGAVATAPTAAELLTVLAELDTTNPVAAAGFRTVLTAAMSRASYQVAPGPHFGLGSPLYCHFTSPIRRYADLVVHRIIHAALSGQPAPYTHDELTGLVGHLNARTGAAARAESLERTMFWSLALGAGLAVGPVLVEEAAVTRITKHGLSVRINRLGVTGLVVADRFGNRWRPAVDGRTADGTRGVVHLGDRLRVTLATVDGTVGRLQFAQV